MNTEAFLAFEFQPLNYIHTVFSFFMCMCVLCKPKTKSPPAPNSHLNSTTMSGQLVDKMTSHASVSLNTHCFKYGYGQHMKIVLQIWCIKVTCLFSRAFSTNHSNSPSISSLSFTISLKMHFAMTTEHHFLVFSSPKGTRSSSTVNMRENIWDLQK